MARTIEEINYIHEKIQSFQMDEKVEDVLVALNNEGTRNELLVFLYDVCLFEPNIPHNSTRFQNARLEENGKAKHLDMKFNSKTGIVEIAIIETKENGLLPTNINDKTVLRVDKNGNCTFGNIVRDTTLLKFKVDAGRIVKGSMEQEENAEAYIRNLGFDEYVTNRLVELLNNNATHDIVENITTYPKEEFEKEQKENKKIFTTKRDGEDPIIIEEYSITNREGDLCVKISGYNDDSEDIFIDEKYQYILFLKKNGKGHIDIIENYKLKERSVFDFENGKVVNFKTEKFKDEKTKN